MTPSKFLQFVSIGFGTSVGITALGMAMWLLICRRLQWWREQQQGAAAAVAAQQLDARRRQTEAVQRMIEERRKLARVVRKPFLVVHPGGDAEVAFKEQAAIPHRASLDDTSSQTGLIKAQRHSHSNDPEAYAQDLLSRRALVAAAALSGRTHSGISDLSFEADEAAAAATEWPDLEGQQQQQQQDGGSSQAPSLSSLSRQSSLAASTQPLLLGQQPSSNPDSTEGIGVGGGSLLLTRLARHHAAEVAGSRGTQNIV